MTSTASDHPFMSITKLLRQIANIKNKLDSITKFVVLVQTGKYNPIRNIHIAALDAARNAIKASDESIKVIGGYISLDPDIDFSLQVGGSYTIPLLHRYKMGAIVTEENDWIDVIDLKPYSQNTKDGTPSAAQRLQDYLRGLPELEKIKDQIEVWNLGGPNIFLSAKEGRLSPGITSVCFFRPQDRGYKTIEEYESLLSTKYGETFYEENHLVFLEGGVKESRKLKNHHFARGAPCDDLIDYRVTRYGEENKLVNRN